MTGYCDVSVCFKLLKIWKLLASVHALVLFETREGWGWLMAIGNCSACQSYLMVSVTLESLEKQLTVSFLSQRDSCGTGANCHIKTPPQQVHWQRWFSTRSRRSWRWDLRSLGRLQRQSKALKLRASHSRLLARDASHCQLIVSKTFQVPWKQTVNTLTKSMATH